MTQLSAASMDTLPAKRITANCSNPYLLKKIYSCLELCDTLKIRHSLIFCYPSVSYGILSKALWDDGRQRCKLKVSVVYYNKTDAQTVIKASYTP